MSRELVLKRKWEGLVYDYVASGPNRGEVRIRTDSRLVVIPSFPHIKRIFALEAGFRKHFPEGKAFVEEKVDGYNVRAVAVDGNVYGFTRGGILCPFTTEKLRENEGLVELLKDNPSLVVNGEMAGPHNPYVGQSPSYVKEDVEFFVFDMMRDGKFLDLDSRNEFVRSYSLKNVRSFGLLDLDGIKDVVRRYYKELEGIVIKSRSRDRAVKYVFPDSDIDDIRLVAKIFPEVNAGYFIQRALRSAMFLEELGLAPNEYYTELGKALLDGFIETARKIKVGEEIYEDFTIKVRRPETVEELVRILSRSREIKVDVVDLKQDSGYYWVTIRKTYPKATKYWRERIHGKAFVD